ncbi:kanadaptin-like isoform X2 [Watersipora subatra]|uniref:kanadaptin-like isoform X2 n=1 Tax=Watersipora subatra TaxID=2589382 RepID=UPI00355B4886
MESLYVGWYLYDLNSTHGTVLNKQRVAPNEFHRLRVGYTFKFGGSSRLHILHGPDDDQDTELTPEDLAALRQKRKNQLEERLKLKPEQEGQTAGGQADADGCSWGIDDDAEDIDPDAVNPFASEEPAEELQLDDPKKALRGWFEREGYDEPEYVVEEKSHGVHVCTVDLPADTPTGQPMRAQVSVQGKKKEAVVQCALEACRLLDRHGLLRQAKHESRKRKAKNWGDNDFYDSDDDTFLDRTGDIEKKRKLRMRRAGKLEEEEREKALTYDQLVGQLMKLETEMKEIQEKLDRNKRMEKDRDADLDDLDAYMMSIKSGGMNATEKTKLKRRMIELKTDTLRLEKLIRIAKPNSLPEVRNKLTSSKTNAVDRSSEQKELEGKEPITSKEASARLAQVSSPNSQIELTHADELNMTPKLDTSVVVAPEAAKDNSIPNTDSPSICKMDISASDRTEASMSLKSQAELEKCLHVSKSDSNDADTPPTQKTQHAPVSESRSSTKPSRKVHVKKSQASVKKAREAPAGGGLAGMVSDLKSKAEEEEYANDPDHITWMPPKGQSGDGRTNLNDKYGY